MNACMPARARSRPIWFKQHPEDPAPLVVGHGRVAGRVAGDLDQRPLGVGLAVLAVARLEPLAEIDPGIEPLDLLDQQDRREVGRALRRGCCLRALCPASGCCPTTGAPPRATVISKAAWFSGLLSVKKPIPSEKVMFVGKPLGVAGQVGKLAQLQLAPGIGVRTTRSNSGGPHRAPRASRRCCRDGRSGSTRPSPRRARPATGPRPR